MQDHAILQRTLYKYEQTMLDLNGAIKGKHHSKDTIIDLKRITDKQLKEIITL